jgi:hypothetical protein
LCACFRVEPEHLTWLKKMFSPGWTGPALGVIARRVGIALVAVLLLNAFILAVTGASPMQLGTAWLRRRRLAADPRQQVALAYLTVCARLARRGLVRESWQTPTDYSRAIALAGTLPEDLGRADLPQFTDEFLRLRYGGASPSPDQLAAFTERARNLARRIRRSKRTPRRS